MTNPANLTAENSVENSMEAPTTPEELSEVIAELEQYRERLVSDTLAMAQRAKVLRSQAMNSLEPNLKQIDATLQNLREQQATLAVKS